MHPDLQAKLLRVLEDQTFTKIGDTKPTKVNVRIIAATNRDLLSEAQNENFRSDLYYRLSVFKIQVPALRDRKEDIPALVESFIEYYSHKINKRIQDISKEYLEKIQIYTWPGNTRELKNVIERAVILSDNGRISQEYLPIEVLFPKDTNLSHQLGTIEEMEKIHIQKMLNYTNGNKTKAAEKLGIDVPTLYRKLEHYGLK